MHTPPRNNFRKGGTPMKRNVLARRAASAALAACMMFSLSAPALAASTDALLQQSTAAKSAVSVLDEENGMTEEPVYDEMDLNRGSITVYIGDDGKQYAKQGDNEAQQRGNLSITTDGSPTNNTITIEGGTTGAKVTLSNVNINASGAAVSVSGNVELIIAGTNTNTLRSGPKHAGVEKADDNGTLTISGFGTLNAYGGESGAGIGGAWHKNASNIVIEGGTIEANGGNWGAGIGGGHGAAGQNITIRDGNVTAKPGGEAAGIGGGYLGDGKNITIEGGTVYSRSGGGSGPVAAIGGGRETGKGENIQITGGNVTLKTVDDDDIYIGNGQQEAEIDTSKLLGTITKLNRYDEQVDEIVQDFNIKINDKPVTRKNYEDILGLCYDIEEKTLKLKDGKSFVGDLTIKAPEDVSIDLEADASHVVNGNLTVNSAKDVKVTKLGGSAAAAIEGNAEITCSGDVILKSFGGSHGDGRNLIGNGLTVHRANTVTTEGGIGGETIINCTGDIKLGNEWGTTVSKLMVNSANNVTMTSGSWYSLIDQGAVIKCSGTVIISGMSPIKGDVTIDAGKDVSLEYEYNDKVINIKAAGKVELNSDSYRNLGKVIFTQAKKKPYVYFTDQSSEYKDSRITPIPETIESSYLRIEPRETYSITVKNGTAQVDDTTGLTSAFEGETITATAPEHDSSASFSKFEGWKLNKGSINEIVKENGEVVETSVKDGYIVGEDGEKIKEKIIRFKMPGEKVEMTAVYSIPAVVQDLPVIVTGGTINDTQDTLIRVKPGTKVTVKADAPADEKASFHHWKVEMGTSADFGVTEGSLGSETETGTEEISFTMPRGAVRLTAVYSIPASVLKSTVTVEGGTAKSTLDEGSNIPAEIGTTVEITATPYDAEEYPGMEFVEWEIKYPDSFYKKFPDGIPEELQLKLDNAKSATTTFEMPAYPVKRIAHWSASAVVKPDPDEPIDEDFGVEPAPMDTTGGTIAAVAVGGAAIWGGYEIATRVILNGLLPEGAAIPANRGQLALLIWTEKGKPEPAAQPAFADITDAELAKAAQWCVEQGLLDAREGKFESDGWMPKFKTIEIWNKAFPKK